VIIALTVAMCAPFVLWGEALEGWFTGEAAIAWLRARHGWGPVAGAGLLVADLVLPVPGTAVMGALGYVYGVGIGTLASVVGSVIGGGLGYEFCQRWGRTWAVRWVGAEAMERYHAHFSQAGGWWVALTRGVPLVAEVVVCLAGLGGMPRRAFWRSLLCGCGPMGLLYAGLGALGHAWPLAALGLSVALPALGLAAVRWLSRAPNKSLKTNIL
jgi:uncharacterized membrane protein YdjX (TVP38/TMEM64 family)